MTSASTEVETAPVFVDQTGLRGRRLRGLGWLLGIICTGFVVAMVSGLIGTQSQAPGLTVPGTANTTPPSQYLNAPLPAAPGVAKSGSSITAPAIASDATASVAATQADGTAASSSVSEATVSDTAAPTAGTAASIPVSEAPASVTAAPTAGTAASSSVSDATTP